MKSLKKIVLILSFLGVCSAASASVYVKTSCGEEYNVIAGNMQDLMDTVMFLESLCN